MVHRVELGLLDEVHEVRRLDGHDSRGGQQVRHPLHESVDLWDVGEDVAREDDVGRPVSRLDILAPSRRGRNRRTSRSPPRWRPSRCWTPARRRGPFAPCSLKKCSTVPSLLAISTTREFSPVRTARRKDSREVRGVPVDEVRGGGEVDVVREERLRRDDVADLDEAAVLAEVQVEREFRLPALAEPLLAQEAVGEAPSSRSR